MVLLGAFLLLVLLTSHRSERKHRVEQVARVKTVFPGCLIGNAKFLFWVATDKIPLKAPWLRKTKVHHRTDRPTNLNIQKVSCVDRVIATPQVLAPEKPEPGEQKDDWFGLSGWNRG